MQVSVPRLFQLQDVAALLPAVQNGSSLHERMWLDIDSTRELLGFEPEDGTAFPRSKADG